MSGFLFVRYVCNYVCPNVVLGSFHWVCVMGAAKVKLSFVFCLYSFVYFLMISVVQSGNIFWPLDCNRGGRSIECVFQKGLTSISQSIDHPSYENVKRILTVRTRPTVIWTCIMPRTWIRTHGHCSTHHRCSVCVCVCSATLLMLGYVLLDAAGGFSP